MEFEDDDEVEILDSEFVTKKVKGGKQAGRKRGAADLIGELCEPFSRSLALTRGVGQGA